MATKIQMNLLNSSGSYEVLYPQTDYSNILNTPTIPTLPDMSNYITKPAYISEGGTQATTASKAIYNLTSGCTTYDSLKSIGYDSAFIPFYMSSTGYNISLSKFVLLDIKIVAISTTETTASITYDLRCPGIAVLHWTSRYGAIKINDKLVGNRGWTSGQNSTLIGLGGNTMKIIQTDDIVSASNLKIKTDGGTTNLVIYMFSPW